VREFKKRWESTCREASKSKADLIRTQQSLEGINEGPPTIPEDLRPLYSNMELARDAGRSVGVEISGSFGPYMLDVLTTALEGAGRLSRERPKTLEDYGSRQLIYETVSATKVLFPHQTLKTTVPGVRELAVWVVDPLPGSMAERTEDEYDFSASFLYLLTPLYHHKKLDTFYSGCSALQMISNLLTGKPFLTVDWAEPLGRQSYLHPVEKLKSIGGIVIDCRWVDTPYMPRYMTDEQCFVHDDRVERIHDLLAYPLYIGNSLAVLAKRLSEKTSV